MSIKLSICIPTYNFAFFIGKTLDSIISQDNGEIEVVIVDGASTDNTHEIIKSYQNKFSQINFFCRDENVGVDRDIEKCVELAKGEYCWFMSSDDVIKPEALARVFKEIDEGCDIYLCNRTECDFDLNPIKERYWLSKNVDDLVINMSNRNELFDYFNKSRSIGALFSYCSSIVFKRAKYNNIAYNDTFTGTGYAHVYKLFSFIESGGKLKYIKDRLVLCRGNNDSFLAKGILKRFLLDIDGYLLLADNIFSKDKRLKSAFLKIMTREILLHYLIEIRSLVPDNDFWNKIERKLYSYGYKPWIVYLSKALGSFKPFVSFLKVAKGISKKSLNP